LLTPNTLVGLILVETMVAASGSQQALQNFSNYKHVLFLKSVTNVLPDSTNFFGRYLIIKGKII